MGSGVGVHADDERMSVRDNGAHSGPVLSLRWAMTPVADDRRRPGKGSLRGIPVMSHDREVGHASDQATEVGREGAGHSPRPDSS